jgi:hypothetical protein
VGLLSRFFQRRPKVVRDLYAVLQSEADQSPDPEKRMEQGSSVLSALVVTLTMQLALGTGKTKSPYPEDSDPFVLGYLFSYCIHLLREPKQDIATVMLQIVLIELYYEAGLSMFAKLAAHLNGPDAEFRRGMDTGIADVKGYLDGGRPPMSLGSHVIKRRGIDV